VNTVIVHNHVKDCPDSRNSTDGFKWWTTVHSDKLAVCNCGWRPKDAPHYRIAGPFSHTYRLRWRKFSSCPKWDRWMISPARNTYRVRWAKCATRNRWAIWPTDTSKELTRG
jgi:hypothetical protein